MVENNVPKDEITNGLKKAVSTQTFDVIKEKKFSSEQLFFFHEFIKTDKWRNADIMTFNKAKRSENKTLLLNSFDSPNIIEGVINSSIMINIPQFNPLIPYAQKMSVSSPSLNLMNQYYEPIFVIACQTNEKM